MKNAYLADYMPKAGKAAILAFSLEFEKYAESMGNNELAINSKLFYNLVTANQDAAWGFVEVYCSRASEQPAYVMTAYVVAATYEIEFGADSLKKMVLAQAKALNATTHIRGIRTTI